MSTADKWKSTGVIGVWKGMTERNKVMLPVWLHGYQVIFKKHPAAKPLSDFFFFLNYSSIYQIVGLNAVINTSVML